MSNVHDDEEPVPPALRLVALVRRERRLAAEDRAVARADRRRAAADRRQAYRYAQSAERDDLTGVLQRGPGLTALRRSIDVAHATGSPMTLAFLDVDHLKTVNDEHGHRAGDELLHAVGQALLAALRDSDLAVRMGGDEFVCALRPATLRQARRRIADVVQELSATRPNGSLSIGLSALRPHDSWEELLARADRLMYEARRQQRELSGDG